MFERFTERARQVVVFAQDEARALDHSYIGTEHLLLGLLREEEGIAARVLESLEVSIEEVRAQVARIVGRGDDVTTGQIPFTPRAKKVLELSMREALSLGHNYIGTEHILLGLARENEGVAAQILLDLGAGRDTIMDAVIRSLSGAPLTEFVPESPPLAPEVAAEIEQLQRERGDAEEADPERVAALRDRERRLVAGARALTRAWKNEPAVEPASAQLPRDPSFDLSERRATSMHAVAHGGRHRRSHRERRRAWQAEALLAGWSMFGVASALGLLAGWLIWG